MGFIGLYAITILAVLFRPTILYNNPSLFVGERNFAFAAVAAYKLFGGQFVLFSSLKNIDDPGIMKVAETIADALALLFLVGVTSLAIWVAARSGRAPLPFRQSTRIACYSIGTIPAWKALESLLGSAIFAAWGQVLENLDFLPVIAIYVIALVAVLGLALTFVHKTVVVPVSILSPGSPTLRVWIGFLLGWTIAMLILGTALLGLSRVDTSFHIGF